MEQRELAARDGEARIDLSVEMEGPETAVPVPGRGEARLGSSVETEDEGEAPTLANASTQTGDEDRNLKQLPPPQSENESPVPDENESPVPDENESPVPDENESPVPDENESPDLDANENDNGSGNESDSSCSSLDRARIFRSLAYQIYIRMARSGFDFNFRRHDPSAPWRPNANVSGSDAFRDLEGGGDGNKSVTESESEGSGEFEGEGASACRVCMSPARFDTVDLGCACKEDMGVIHRECALEWFGRRRNTVCEICGSACPNLVALVDFEDVQRPRRYIPPPVVPRPLPVPPVEARRPSWWRQRRFIHLVIAFGVIACVLPWIFVYFT